MTLNFPSYMVSTFDIPSTSWNLRTIESSLPGQLARDVVAAYTPDDRLVLASQDQLGNYELLIEQPGAPFYAINVPSGIRRGPPSNFTSIATYGNEVAFMFADPDRLSIKVGIFDGTLTTFESVPSEDGLPDVNINGIAPGSLAYAPDGTLSLVYVEEQSGAVVFAQRSAPGDWNLEPVSGGNSLLASLAFAANGTPYVGVADFDGIDLYSPAYNPIPGDANGDGQVTAADLVILDANFGQAGTFSDGDFNGDGVVTAADLVILDANFGAGVGSVTNASGVTAIPEPSSLALLGLAGLLLTCRRYWLGPRTIPHSD
ncbi:MAG: dockerin type I repeat-containing protein [Planctomycetota bacterium]